MPNSASSELDYLSSHPRFGVVFTRSWQVWLKGNVAPVRGRIGVVKGLANGQISYWPDPKGAGCCLIGAAMLGLECRVSLGKPLIVSWMSFLTVPEKRGLLHGFDGLPEDEAYNPAGTERIKGDPGHDLEAFEFGRRARAFVETALGAASWVGVGEDPVTSPSPG